MKDWNLFWKNFSIYIWYLQLSKILETYWYWELSNLIRYLSLMISKVKKFLELFHTLFYSLIIYWLIFHRLQAWKKQRLNYAKSWVLIHSLCVMLLPSPILCSPHRLLWIGFNIIHMITKVSSCLKKNGMKMYAWRSNRSSIITETKE